MEQEKNKVIQHYVPQCYLRKFGINKKKIFKFSKSTHECSEVKIKECCQMDDFYTLVDRSKPLYIEEDILDHREENVFGVVLEKLLNFSNDFIKGKTDNLNLTESDYLDIARGVAEQYLRGPRYRHAAIQKEMKSDYARIFQLCHYWGFDIEEIGYQYNESNIHGDIIASESVISRHSNFICNKNWEFLFTTGYFVTSDEPVVVIPSRDIIAPVLPHETLEYFGQIFYPLNSHLLLKITHLNSVKGKEHNDKFRVIQSDELEEINKIVISNSREFYFCEINKEQ